MAPTTGVSTSVATSTAPAPATTVAISAGVPAYFSPGPLWDVMLSTANTGDARVSMAVMNPANGPGLEANTAYASVVAATKAKGIRILGYVATGYGSRTSVLADIDAYKRFYGISDIFLDESTADCVSLATYTPWIAAVRANGGLAVVNPGIVPAPCWGPAADVIVTFEGTYDAYQGFLSPPWTRELPAAAFWHIVYAVPPGSAGFVREAAARNHAGLLYATEDVLPNPYDSLPAALSVVTTPPATAAPVTAGPVTFPPFPVSATTLAGGGPTAPARAVADAPPPTFTTAAPSTTDPGPPLVIVLDPAATSSAVP